MVKVIVLAVLALAKLLITNIAALLLGMSHYFHA